MGKTVEKFKLFLIGGFSAAAVSACAPSYQMSAHDVSTQEAYGYSQSAYGYEAAQQSVVTHRSRYGGELRGGCQVEVQGCGFRTVVPVYPVYQIITPPPTPEAQVVEVPQIIQPEPTPYIEPEPIPYVEPIYEPPVHDWPEPETPVRDWTPLRK